MVRWDRKRYISQVMFPLMVRVRNSYVKLTTTADLLLFLSTVNAEFEKQPWKKMFKR